MGRTCSTHEGNYKILENSSGKTSREETTQENFSFHGRGWRFWTK
jgi:hypothetical protein